MILKPLEEVKEEKKTEEKPKQTKERKQYSMVTKLDDLEGTQVLSEEEELEESDPFQTKNTANSHYVEDLGMPDLPIDSDKSE